MNQLAEYMHDLDELSDILRQRYPSPTNAIEDYRKGYVSKGQLELCFSGEEIAYILEKARERDESDQRAETGPVL